MSEKSTSEHWSPIPSTYHPLKAGSIDGTDTEPHDHGIVRALQAQYSPNKLVVGDPKLTLFVGRLNPRTTESTVKKFFSQYGSIRRCRLVRDIVTGFSKCYAFVEFKDRQDALRAHHDAYRAVLDKTQIFVDFECERTLPGWVPRRLGGGLGGKKESGQLRFGGRLRPFKKPLIAQSASQRDSRESQHRRHRDHDNRERDRSRTNDRNFERDDSNRFRHRRSEKRRSSDY